MKQNVDRKQNKRRRYKVSGNVRGVEVCARGRGKEGGAKQKRDTCAVLTYFHRDANTRRNARKCGHRGGGKEKESKREEERGNRDSETKKGQEGKREKEGTRESRRKRGRGKEKGDMQEWGFGEQREK